MRRMEIKKGKRILKNDNEAITTGFRTAHLNPDIFVHVPKRDDVVVELKSEQRFWEFPQERFENHRRYVDVVVGGKVDRLTAIESLLHFTNVLRVGGSSGINDLSVTELMILICR